MCVSAIAIGVSAKWPLVIVGNRDEFFERPTLELHEWLTPAGVKVWGGRDQQDGGGWMLIAADGSAAALVTNVRDARLQRGELSRGQLALNWIDAVALGTSDQFWSGHDWQRYGGFNLLCGQPLSGKWWYFSNRTGQPPASLPRGLYGLSNARLDSAWPKSEKLKASLRGALLEPDPTSLANTCWPTLANSELVANDLLPDTGVGLASEQRLSSVFINWPERGYGTRSSHVISLGGQGKLVFDERTYPTTPHLDRQHHFKLRSLLAY